MSNIKRSALLLTMLAFAAVFCSCGSSDYNDPSAGIELNEHYKDEDSFSIDASAAANYIRNDPALENIKGKTIYWLSNYDINPANNQDRSVALSLFEDEYGCKVEYINCDYESKFDVLASRILGGDPVDMFPYEWDAVPNGVVKDQYQPLDEYVDLDSEIWDGMRDVADMFVYKGSHYVIPYTISNPLLLTYRRSMCDENNLPDPYELYKEGKWDWDIFMDMMTEFVSGAESDETRYGINGWFGQALIQSTGETVINYDGEKFTNNIKSAAIENAENVMKDIMKQKLYNPEWQSYLIEDGSTLFFAMADWTLGESNVKNEPDPEMTSDGYVQSNDLMIVPFPKDPDADKYYLNCSFGAKMLVKNSENCDAVGAYIKCERLAAIMEEYKQDIRSKALIPNVSAAGVMKGYITAEQYDALCEYTDAAKITPVMDFGYGMGTRMYSDGEYTYETRGIMDNITSALLNGDRDSWAVVRDEWSPVIDEILSDFNSK